MCMCFISFMNVPSDYQYTLPASPCPIRSVTLSHLQTDFLNVQVNKSSLIKHTVLSLLLDILLPFSCLPLEETESSIWEVLKIQL